MFPKPPKISIKKISAYTNQTKIFSPEQFHDLETSGMDFFFDLSPDSEVAKSLIEKGK